MSLKLITPPTAEPLTLAEAKAQCRVYSTDDDAYLTSLIAAVRQQCEQITQRSLMVQKWQLTLDAFPAGAIALGRPPLIGVTSFTYVDSDGVQQTLLNTAYALDASSDQLAWLAPLYGQDWPAKRAQINAVQVQFNCGFAASATATVAEQQAAVPQNLKQWMLLKIGELYEHREATVVAATTAPHSFVDRLLDPHRIRAV